MAASILFFGVKEPDIMESKEGAHQAKKTFLGRMKSLVKQTYQACRDDHALFIGLIGVVVTRNQNFVQ